MVWRVLVITALGVLGLTSCGWTRNTAEDETAIGQTITSVRVTNDSGNVNIKTGDQTKVHRKIHYNDDKPGSTHRVEGAALIVEACNVRDCSIDYDIVVPAGTKVTSAVDSGNTEITGVASANVKASSGGVTVRGVAGAVNVDSDAGSVQVSDIGAAVKVNAQSGRVTLDNVRAAASVQADSGTIEARGIGGAVDLRADSGTVNASLTSQQNVRAATDSGNVTVTVPRGAYRVKTSTDSGNVRGDVTSDSTGTHEIDLHTDSGNITLAYN
jgi:DUF4097 and DUF4098 domain-containing protein YvlB